jgi:hypothetical protein
MPTAAKVQILKIGSGQSAELQGYLFQIAGSYATRVGRHYF